MNVGRLYQANVYDKNGLYHVKSVSKTYGNTKECNIHKWITLEIKHLG